MTNRNYPCEFCDTELEQAEKLVTVTMRRGDRWYIFENVPARVCPNCGHRYFAGPILLQLEEMIQNKPASARPVEAWAVTLADVNP